jgi:hypothetical protein
VYDGDIMTSRTQVTLDAEMQRRVRDRARELGISFAEYVRRLVERDLGEPGTAVSPKAVFNLGSSGGSDVARDKDKMIAVALIKTRRGRRRKS